MRRHLSFANAVSLIALFVALGGGAYALTLSKGSVDTKQLHKGAVTTKKLHKGAVTSRKTKNGSLLAKDFKAGELLAGPEGPRGPEGPQGKQGETGAAGTSPVTRFARVSDTGGLLDGSSGTTADRTGSGTYAVTFDRDVSDCAYSATATIVARIPGVERDAGDPETVFVFFTNENGAVADASFYVLVYC